MAEDDKQQIKDKSTLGKLAESTPDFYEALYRVEKDLKVSVLESLFYCTTLRELKTYLETLKSDEIGKNIQFVSKHDTLYDAEKLLKHIERFEETAFIQDVPKIEVKGQNLRDKVFQLKVAEMQEEARKKKEMEQKAKVETEKVLDLLLHAESVDGMRLILKTVNPDLRALVLFPSVSGEPVSYEKLEKQLEYYQTMRDPKDISRVQLGAIHLRDKVKQLEAQSDSQKMLKGLFESKSLDEIIELLTNQLDKDDVITFHSKNSVYSPSKLLLQLQLFKGSGNATFIPSISYNGVTLEDRLKQLES